MKKILLGLLSIYLTTNAIAQTKLEFRGVWIATVDNIDWPSAGNTDTEEQKAEFIQLLNTHKRNGINAIVAQIRPCADAFYPSSLEPWSHWLTGKQGTPPSPYYDPLQFMITETHKRGMVFHAWLNPYRAVFNIGGYPLSATHITRLHPEWFVTYGDKRYFDPGNKEAQQYVVNIIKDVVSRYDIDAVHLDDYFYPYRIAKKEFPDWASFNKYGNGLRKAAWRRSNVDSIICKLSRTIKEENSHCQFGISPFGIWRNSDKDPEGSDTQGGLTNYDDLYADIVLWLKNGWIDYVAPQLYWEIGHRIADYEILINWWNDHTYGRHCYIGLAPYRAGDNAAWRNKKQLPRQIELLRKAANVQGMIFFSSNSLEKNVNGWSDSLRLNYFKDSAAIPTMKWLEPEH
jgi:uncharacterized lipoprotein YddW (UPF0748 family)